MDQGARPRIVGVDVARALAVLGMFAAHVADREAWRLANGASGFEAFDGRSSAGFALLAGVSAALLSGGSRPATGPRMTHARVRVLARAALLWPLGLALIALRTPVAVILPHYALLFAITAAFLSLRPRTLAVIATAIAVAAPPAVERVRELAGPDAIPYSGLQAVGLRDLLIGRHYPVAIWLAYLLVGLAVGRLDLRSGRVRVRMLVLGVAGAAIGFVTNAVAMRSLPPERTLWRKMLTTEPHASSAIELLANVGVVVAVLALCLMLADLVGRAVAPLAATGAFALTAYCGHIVGIATIGESVWSRPDIWLLVRFVVVTVGVAWAWRYFLGRGPLELMVSMESTIAADRIVPAGRRDARPAQPERAERPEQVDHGERAPARAPAAPEPSPASAEA